MTLVVFKDVRRNQRNDAPRRLYSFVLATPVVAEAMRLGRRDDDESDSSSSDPPAEPRRGLGCNSLGGEKWEEDGRRGPGCNSLGKEDEGRDDDFGSLSSSSDEEDRQDTVPVEPAGVPDPEKEPREEDRRIILQAMRRNPLYSSSSPREGPRRRQDSVAGRR